MSKAGDQKLKDMLSRFGVTVRSRRMALGISQEELADRAVLHRTYITDVERGRRNLTMVSVTKLAKALEVPLTQLFLEIEKEASGFDAQTGEIDSKAVDILLVEDNAKHAELTLNALEKYGVGNPILVVPSGEAALDYLFHEGRYQHRPPSPNPKVVLLDLTLPTMSGLEVLSRLRKDARTQSLAVVVLTASRSDQDYKECKRLGVSAYITKPVNFVEFSGVMPTLGYRWLLLKNA